MKAQGIPSWVSNIEAGSFCGLGRGSLLFEHSPTFQYTYSGIVLGGDVDLDSAHDLHDIARDISRSESMFHSCFPTSRTANAGSSPKRQSFRECDVNAV